MQQLQQLAQSQQYRRFGAYTGDSRVARIDEQICWTFGHLSSARLAALGWAFSVRDDTVADPSPWTELAAKGGTSYLSAQECRQLGEQLAVVCRDRVVALEAKKRLLRAVRCTTRDRQEIAKALRDLFALALEQEKLLGRAAPIVLVQSGDWTDTGVTHELAMQLAVLFGIVEDIDDDGSAEVC